MHLWDDAYGMVQCRNVMMQCRQILVDWARMHDTKYNIRMTRSNGKSPKFLSEKLSTFEGKRISAIKAISFKILHRNVTTTKSHRKEDSMVGCKITSRRIDFRNPIANHYAESSSIASEQENLITTLIRGWLQAVVSKLKSGTVQSEIGLGVEYQKGRRHPQLSNGNLLAFIRSTVQVLRLFARRWVCWKLQFWTDCSDERKIKSVLFGWDSSLELSTKKLDNSPRFPSVTYRASTNQRFGSYRILCIGKTAENWTG
jgi:hypothetical protein